MGVSCRVGDYRRIEIATTGQQVVDYTRCGYLSLDSHPRVLAAARAAADEIKSVHFSVARTRLSAEPLARLESTLSNLFQVNDVVVFPTVAAANMGALPLLAAGLFTGGVKPLIVFDRFAHVTLQYHIPVLREETDVIVIEHNDLKHLERLCQSHPLVAYVGDGAYSMGGAAPVRELRSLQDKYGLFVYLDDAHGISVVGKRGEGFVRSQLSGLDHRTIVAASLLDGATLSSIEMALAKGRTAALGRRESKFYEDLVKQGRVAFLSAPMTGFLEGGVPIIAAGEVVGSVSVSGVKSEEDADIARAGIAALGL